MNITKGEQWEILTELVKRESADLVILVLEHMTEETYKYERGEAFYPRIEYFISLAKNTIEEKRKLRKLRIEAEAEAEAKAESKSTVPLIKKPPIPSPTQPISQPTPPPSPRSIKLAVRESWLKKFDAQAQALKVAEVLEAPKPKIPVKRRINVKRL